MDVDTTNQLVDEEQSLSEDMANSDPVIRKNAIARWYELQGQEILARKSAGALGVSLDDFNFDEALHEGLSDAVDEVLNNRFSAQGLFTTFAHTCVRNAYLNIVRDNSPEKLFRLAQRLEKNIEKLAISEQIERKAILAATYAAIEKLSSAEKRLIHARYGNGMALNDYAADAGETPDEVYARHSRMLKKLKRALVAFLVIGLVFASSMTIASLFDSYATNYVAGANAPATPTISDKQAERPYADTIPPIRGWYVASSSIHIADGWSVKVIPGNRYSVDSYSWWVTPRTAINFQPWSGIGWVSQHQTLENGNWYFHLPEGSFRSANSQIPITSVRIFYSDGDSVELYNPSAWAVDKQISFAIEGSNEIRFLSIDDAGSTERWRLTDPNITQIPIVRLWTDQPLYTRMEPFNIQYASNDPLTNGVLFHPIFEISKYNVVRLDLLHWNTSGLGFGTYSANVEAVDNRNWNSYKEQFELLATIENLQGNLGNGFDNKNAIANPCSCNSLNQLLSTLSLSISHWITLERIILFLVTIGFWFLAWNKRNQYLNRITELRFLLLNQRKLSATVAFSIG